MLAIVMGVLLLFRFLMPQFVTLRALGAPRLFISAVAWGFTATLMVSGVVLGLAGGYALSFAVSRWLAAETGVALSPTLASSEYLVALAILALGWTLAILPAYMVQRRPLATAMAET
jgi:putative ABC transport system permease protein